jgi:bifunctional DNase/RNase
MDEMLEAEIWSVTHINQGKAVLLRPVASDLVVPIFIGPLELHAILLGLGGVKVKRPLTCDILLELLHRLGLILFRVEVHDIRDEIFLARLLLGGREFSEAKPLVIDSRPSDAIALAVREQCPVYLAPRVLDQAGIPVDIFIEGMESPGFPGGPEAAPVPADYGGTDRGGAGPGGADRPGGEAAGTDSPGEEGPGPKPGLRQDREEAPPGTGPEGIPSLAVRRRRLQAELEEAVIREAYERAAEIRDLLILLDQQVEKERRGKGDT